MLRNAPVRPTGGKSKLEHAGGVVERPLNRDVHSGEMDTE